MLGISPTIFLLHVFLQTTFFLLYTHAATFDPATYRPLAAQAGDSAVQLIQIVVDIDCQSFISSHLHGLT